MVECLTHEYCVPCCSAVYFKRSKADTYDQIICFKKQLTLGRCRYLVWRDVCSSNQRECFTELHFSSLLFLRRLRLTLLHVPLSNTLIITRSNVLEPAGVGLSVAYFFYICGQCTETAFIITYVETLVATCLCHILWDSWQKCNYDIGGGFLGPVSGIISSMRGMFMTTVAMSECVDVLGMKNMH